MNQDIPKKSLGQHWLNDQQILDNICDEALVHEHDIVLEIGPGLGSLTATLLNRGAFVLAVELDEKLAKKLAVEIDSARLRIIQEDILEFDLTKLPPNYKVVANIPYYLTGKLIRILSESSNPPKAITLLVQKEVAERICAKPGAMSILSVSAQTYYNCSLGEIVKAEKFTPPPKVDSQVVHLLKKQVPAFGQLDKKAYFQVIKTGFSNRRKTLLNSLSGGLHLTKEQVLELLNKAGVNPKARPQELILEEWVQLTKHINT